jgi:hypothetical protein
VSRLLIIELGLLFFAGKVGAFVPPLSAILKANFDGRKGLPVETVFRHQIISRTGESITVEERLSEVGGKIYLIFRSSSFGDVGATWSKGVYQFSSDKKVVGRSKAFNLFFTMHKPESYREVLIGEQFLRRDFFSQYKSPFVPQGDPSTWDLKENYVIHPELKFSRTPSGPAITAVGFEESGVRKSVSFGKDTLVLSRLEWKEGSQITSWNFQGVKKLKGDGSFPLELFLNVDNKEVITSTLVSRQYLTDSGAKQWMTKFNSASRSSLTSTLEEGLKVLLEYR